MKLTTGNVESVKFGLFKNRFLFEADQRGFVLEKDDGAVCLYATDASHESIYCAIPMGPYKNLKYFQFYLFCPDDQKLLCAVGRALFVVDFTEKWAATNVDNFEIFGSDHWGQQCQRPWDQKFLKLFGLPDEEAPMDHAAAEQFWQWFMANEPVITEKLGGDQATEVVELVDKELAPIFPYVPGHVIEFQLGWNQGAGEFFFYHHGHERLQADGETLGRMMPDPLRERWSYKNEN